MKIAMVDLGGKGGAVGGNEAALEILDPVLAKVTPGTGGIARTESSDTADDRTERSSSHAFDQKYLLRRSAEEERRNAQATCPSAKLAHRLLAAAYARRAAAFAAGSHEEEKL
ncbi:hypothetical protein [Sphingomonas sp. PAMC 26621]|uniref:hypothetical protein n=1 Tax=Sphingomonas sp. PAMC 26621 TaxID=1112213 RepID=UPI00028897C8|nr:hypothetical protein [Sphingomonas sp. PAMC 26621]